MRLIDVDALKELLIDTLESIKKNPKMDGQEAHIIAACFRQTAATRYQGNKRQFVYVV